MSANPVELEMEWQLPGRLVLPKTVQPVGQYWNAALLAVTQQKRKAGSLPIVSCTA